MKSKRNEIAVNPVLRQKTLKIEGQFPQKKQLNRNQAMEPK